MVISKKNTARAISLAVLATVAAFALTSCSSAPKRPAETFTSRNSAIAQLDLANRAASKGDFANAHLFLDEAWRLATGTDDPATRVSVLIARGNAWFNQNEREKADGVWAQALSEAETAKLPALASAAKVYRARGTLAEGLPADALGEAERKTRAERAKAVALAEMGALKGNPLHEAFAWKVVGLSDKELGKSDAAIESIQKSRALHEKGNYLEDAAYDWYLVASIQSKAGRHGEARASLDKALAFDRRAENSNGLGQDWIAIGIVEEKAGNADKANAAYSRAADIFRAAFMPESAAAAESRIAAR
jgi:tetratricopeptide (TPR) repeat protein